MDSGIVFHLADARSHLSALVVEKKAQRERRASEQISGQEHVSIDRDQPIYLEEKIGVRGEIWNPSVGSVETGDTRGKPRNTWPVRRFIYPNHPGPLPEQH
jgi:hypothetical protein